MNLGSDGCYLGGKDGVGALYIFSIYCIYSWLYFRFNLFYTKLFSIKTYYNFVNSIWFINKQLCLNVFNRWNEKNLLNTDNSVLFETFLLETSYWLNEKQSRKHLIEKCYLLNYPAKSFHQIIINVIQLLYLLKHHIILLTKVKWTTNTVISKIFNSLIPWTTKNDFTNRNQLNLRTCWFIWIILSNIFLHISAESRTIHHFLVTKLQ